MTNQEKYEELRKSTLAAFLSIKDNKGAIELFANLLADALMEIELAHEYLDNATEACTLDQAMKRHNGMGVIALRIHDAIKAEMIRDLGLSNKGKPLPSEICRRLGYQDCGNCDRKDCYDNRNPEGASFQ